MKSVALVGFAPESLDLARQTQADEIWSMLSAEYNLNLPRIDRLFEIHPLDFLLDPSSRPDRAYIPYLKSEHPFPVYMQDHFEIFPASVKYPFDEICAELFPYLKRISGDPIYYFTSTGSFMLALAVYLGFERVEIYGFEMGTDTEYRYQKASMEFMIGVATGRGVEIVLPDKCKLLRAKVYGYEALHMITRSQLESLFTMYQNVRREKEALANSALGEWMQISEKEKMGKVSSKRAQEVWDRLEVLRAEVHGNAGAMQAIRRLIQTCDMEVTEEVK